jgi:hypothetical protein
MRVSSALMYAAMSGNSGMVIGPFSVPELASFGA